MDQNSMRTFGALFAGSLVKKLGFLSLLFFSVNSIALDDDLGNNFETENSLNPLDAFDAQSGNDLDGLTAIQELSIGSSPISDDTDRDTLPDGLEVSIGRDPLLADYQVSLGGHHSCALDDTGVSCWGYNLYGQVDVPALSNPYLIAAGGNNSCAADDSGIVCWGSNNNINNTPSIHNVTAIAGGDGGFCAANSTDLVCWGSPGISEVPPIHTLKDFDAGTKQACAIDSNGLICWGERASGIDHSGNDFKSVVVGSGFVCAASNDHVSCWGLNSHHVENPPQLSSIDMLVGGDDNVCAFHGESEITCWGYDGFGETIVEDTINPSMVSLGGNHSCGIENSGISCWGFNEYGQADAPTLNFYSVTDNDKDGIPDVDTDADGIGNNADTDDDNDGAVDLYDAFPLDGSKNLDKNGSEIVMSLGNHYYQASNPSVEALSDGGFVSIWGSCNTYCQVKDIYGRRFGPDGVALGEQFLVNTETYESQLDPVLAGLSDGGFVVAWTGFQSGSGQIYGQRFGSNGEKIGDEFLVADDSQNTTRYIDIVGLNNGGFAVIWPSYDRGGLYAQMFDANGLPDGEELLIDATPESHLSFSAAFLPSGGFVVARVGSWLVSSETPGIYIYHFSEDGAASSEPILLAIENQPHYQGISIATLSNGGFVVSWAARTGTYIDILAQIFSPDGGPFGDEFVLTGSTSSSEINPKIAPLSDGGFFIAWEGDHHLDGSDTAVIGQRLAPDGAFIGGEVLVNSSTDGYQNQHSVSGGSNGNFVVTWVSSGVIAQRFSLKLDSDDDGVADTYDLFPLDPNETLDTDNDGIGDNTDTDGDNDGVEDSLDAFPFDPTETTDTDLDGIGNNADSDDDNDGIYDSLDTSPLDGVNGFLYSIDGDNVTITGCFSACPAELVIPNTLVGKSVIGIGPSAFSGSGIVSVEIPEGITEIGEGAFARNQLTSVTIPGSVKVLEATFFDNYQLSSVTIGDGVNVIGRSVFNSTNLTSVNIPNSVTTIGESAFLNNQLTTVTIPESVTSIGDRAFDRNKLTSITIPDSVTIIGRDAFAFNQLTNVIIPGSVTSLGSGAFRRNQLTNVTILQGVTVIKGGAFQDNQLTNVIIPESVTSLGSGAFRRNQLTNVTILQGVTVIKGDAFAFNQLTSVTIPESVTTLSSTAFSDNIGVNNGTWKYFLISNDAMIFGCVETCPPDLVIPESIDGYSVKIIGTKAFRWNNLTSVSIPSSVTTVNAWAFGGNQFTQVSFLGARPVLYTHAFASSLALSNISYCEDQAGWPGAEIESVTPVSNGQCDSDSDGVNDDNDAFPDDPAESIDTDGDGIGNNSDTDDDNDGIADVDDAYPLDPTVSSDTDNDGVADNFDAFPLNASETLDHDGDGIGNNSDTDDDNDGLSDTAEITIGTNPLLVDTDGDDFIDGSDAFPLDFLEWLDTDNDGIGNNTDLDDDSDGIEDALDRFSLIPYDPTQKLLDIDGNGRVGALTDALIILRYMFGFNGDALIDDAVAEDATRTSSEEIEAYLGSLMPNL